jgi:hypothetical protein
VISGTQRIRGWASQSGVNFLPLTRNPTLGCSAHRQSLYLLRYTGTKSQPYEQMQDVEDIKKNMMAKLNAASLEAFSIFKNFLNDATDKFKQKR